MKINANYIKLIITLLLLITTFIIILFKGGYIKINDKIKDNDIKKELYLIHKEIVENEETF